MEDKFASSIEKYRNHLKQLQQARRTIRTLEPGEQEVMAAGGKRLRVVPTIAKCTVPPIVQLDLSLSDSDEESPRPVCEYAVGRGRISILPADLERLNEGIYLDDKLIDVILAWLADHELSNGRRASSVVCSSHLFTQMVRGISDSDDTDAVEEKLRQNFSRVSRWFPGGTPFNNNSIYIPVCENNHWLLAIVVMNLTAEPREATIMVLNSLQGTTTPRITQTIAAFINHGLPNTRVFRHIMPVVQQRNGYDCGLHLVHNAQKFMRHTTRYPETTEQLLVNALNEAPCPVTRKEVRSWLIQMGTKTTPFATIEPTPTDEPTVVHPGSTITINNHIRLSNRAKQTWYLNNEAISKIKEAVGAMNDQQTPRTQRKKFKQIIAREKLCFRLNPSTKVWTVNTHSD